MDWNLAGFVEQRYRLVVGLSDYFDEFTRRIKLLRCAYTRNSFYPLRASFPVKNSPAVKIRVADVKVSRENFLRISSFTFFFFSPLSLFSFRPNDPLVLRIIETPLPLKIWVGFFSNSNNPNSFSLSVLHENSKDNRDISSDYTRRMIVFSPIRMFEIFHETIRSNFTKSSKVNFEFRSIPGWIGFSIDRFLFWFLKLQSRSRPHHNISIGSEQNFCTLLR